MHSTGGGVLQLSFNITLTSLVLEFIYYFIRFNFVGLDNIEAYIIINIREMEI